MYSDEETPQTVPFKTWTPDITSRDKRAKKISRVRLSVQATLFNATRAGFDEHSPSQNDETTEPTQTRGNPEEALRALKRVSSEIIASSNRKIEKYRSLAKKLILESVDTSIRNIPQVTSGTPEEPSTGAKDIDSLATLNNSEQSKDAKHDNPDSYLFIPASSEISFDSNPDRENSIEDEDHSESFVCPPKNFKQRHSIFFTSRQDEVEELKEELQVEDNPDIHFIQGNFDAYYEEQEILGEGATGTVKKCIKKGTTQEYAVKVVRYRGDTEILLLHVKEFKNHRKLNHKNIIKVYKLFIDYFTKKAYIVMELAECGEMLETITDLGHYSEAVASGIFKQILAGVNYLHMNGVCHRDLKPNNILVSRDGKIVKITDFNVSKFSENKSKTYTALSTGNYKMWTHTGTLAFTAPEVFIDSQYTEAVDMWSAGVVLYTMLCGYQPFQGEDIEELTEQIQAGQYEFHSDPWDNISQQAKDLIKCLMDVNPKTRYSPFQALIHPWVAKNGAASDKSISGVVENLWVYLNSSSKKKEKKNKKKQAKEDQSPDSCNSINLEKNYGRRGSRKTYDDISTKGTGSHVEDELNLFETPSKKNKDFFFVNQLTLMKNTFSSSQIEGKCLKSLTDTNDKSISPLKRTPPRLLKQFSTFEELPQIFNSSKKVVEEDSDTEVQEDKKLEVLTEEF